MDLPLYFPIFLDQLGGLILEIAHGLYGVFSLFYITNTTKGVKLSDLNFAPRNL